MTFVGEVMVAVRRRILSATGQPEKALVEAIRMLPVDQRRDYLPEDLIARDDWHSWDPTPWAHPWLTPANLRAAKAFDSAFMTRLIETHGHPPDPGTRFGFVGNLANNMTLRALPLRQQGLPISLYLHPSDRYVMSQPGWEFSDALLASGETNIDRLAAMGFTLPVVEGSVLLPAPEPLPNVVLRQAMETPATAWPPPEIPAFIRQFDLLTWPNYFGFLPALTALQSCSALFAAAHGVYLAYLSRRPYLAAQTGGDLWLEASRNDALGNLQRRSYGRASAILATNPWAYANARRFGFRHVLYVPLLVDTSAYAPGPSAARAEWQSQVGGDFFVLVTARLDRTWKGSHIGLEGFARFATRHPGARLIVIGWGEHDPDLVAELDRQGLQGRYVRVPTSGKRKLQDYLRGADCVIDQFVVGYYGATALEAMATGTPVVMRLERAQYDAICPTGAPPVLDAATAGETDQQLERLFESADERASRSAASRQWVVQNHSVDAWGAHYRALLNAVAVGAAFDFSGSPLANPLTDEERAYHDAGLRSAAPFPQYEI
jgi:glycosyltransferase involved in cell wall biosynthesis